MPSLSTLALRVADITRQATALITTLAVAAVQRAFTMIEWDEGKHPRGPNGKFIGGAGLQAEREAYHAGRAIEHFKSLAKHMNETEYTKAMASFHLKTRQGQDIVGLPALGQHQRTMTRSAMFICCHTGCPPGYIVTQGNCYGEILHHLHTSPARCD
jgi:hypothetical protein